MDIMYICLLNNLTIMKKIALLLSLLATAGMTAQEYGAPTEETQNESKTNFTDYNRWSIDLGAGMNKPLRPMRSGYFTKTPDFLNAHVGVRYMFNDKFGLQANAQFNKFESASN